MVLALLIFLVSVVGFVLHRNHALMLLLALELMLLAVTLVVLTSAMTFDTSTGQTLGMTFVTIAGAESAIGLSILVAYYRLRGSVTGLPVYLTLVVLPFVGAFVVAVRGRSLGFHGAGILTTASIGVSALLAWAAVYEVVLARSPVALVAFDWLSIGPDSLTLQWAFLFDDLSVVMCAVVLTVSTMVHVYSLDYMAGDPHGQRFMALLSLFTAFMVLLVTGDSLAIMFAGWEGIGVSSFLLIGFWLTRVQAAKSAVKAITVNRVGDLFLTLGLFMAFTVFGSLSYAPAFATALWVEPGYDQAVLVTMTLLMLIGGMAKSAQVPLHTWLAAAMEG